MSYLLSLPVPVTYSDIYGLCHNSLGVHFVKLGRGKIFFLLRQIAIEVEVGQYGGITLRLLKHTSLTQSTGADPKILGGKRIENMLFCSFVRVETIMQGLMH